VLEKWTALVSPNEISTSPYEKSLILKLLCKQIRDDIKILFCAVAQTSNAVDESKLKLAMPDSPKAFSWS